MSRQTLSRLHVSRRRALLTLAAACVAALVWIIALIGVKEVPLSSGFEDATEVAAVDASGAPSRR